MMISWTDMCVCVRQLATDEKAFRINIEHYMTIILFLVMAVSDQRVNHYSSRNKESYFATSTCMSTILLRNTRACRNKNNKWMHADSLVCTRMGVTTII